MLTVSRLMRTFDDAWLVCGYQRGSITSPAEGERVGRFTTVYGVGPAGRTVEVSVLPQSDVWYYQGSARIDEDGEWDLACWIGNDETPPGLRFTISAKCDNGQRAVRHVRSR